MTGDDNHSDDDDKTLWAYVTRNVRPITRETKLFPPTEPPRKARERHPATTIPRPKLDQLQHWIETRQIAENNAAAPAASLNRRMEQKLRQGKMPIDGTLDLHGLTQDEAYGALIHTLSRAHTQGKRCLLVITGKGRSAQSEGILKKRVPQWLAMPPLRDIVLRTSPARPHHGGDGALYVLLRRRKD